MSKNTQPISTDSLMHETRTFPPSAEAVGRALIDEQTYRDAGQGGFEIRTFISTAAAAGGAGDLQFYTAELPIFAVGCTVAKFAIDKAA